MEGSVGPTTRSPSRNGKLLYILEYSDNSGWVHKIPIYQRDEPSRVAKRLAVAAKIPKELID